MRWCAAAFVIGGLHFFASSASESAGCFMRSTAISWSFRGSASTSSCLIASSCCWAASDRALHVRLVGVGQAVCVGPGRGDDGVLVETQRRLAGAGEREEVGDRLARLRVCGRVSAALDHLERDAVARRDVREERGAFAVGGPNLEVRRVRAGQAAGAEESAAEVGAAAAGAAEDALRRPAERGAARGEHARLAERRRLGRPDVEMELEAGARGRTHGAGRCGSPSGCRGRAAAGRPASPRPASTGRARPTAPRGRGGARFPRHGRGPTARPACSSAGRARSPRARCAARQRATCSSASMRRLYSTPSPPNEPIPSDATTRWHGMNGERWFRAQNVPAARAAPGRPASAASSP